MIKTEELLPEDSPENPELHGMSGQSEGSFQSPDEEAACESPYGSVSPPRDLPGTSLGDSSEYGADFNEIQRVIVHHGSCTGETLGTQLCMPEGRPQGCGGLGKGGEGVGWMGDVKFLPESAPEGKFLAAAASKSGSGQALSLEEEEAACGHLDSEGSCPAQEHSKHWPSPLSLGKALVTHRDQGKMCFRHMSHICEPQ